MRTIRGICALCLLVTLGAAGSAGATGDKPATFTGGFDSGGEVSFRLSGGSGDRAVDQISITGIAAECRRGSATLDFEIFGETPVNEDRSFAVRSLDGTGGKAKVRGQFSRKFKRVKGSVRVHGKFFDDTARCDSGRQKFKAG